MKVSHIKRRQRLLNTIAYRKHAHKRALLLTTGGVAVFLMLGTAGTWGWVLARRHFSPVHVIKAQASDHAGSHVALQTPPSATTEQVATTHDYTIPPVVNGVAPFITHLPTKEPVIFLGIDDGQNKEQFELDLMQQYNVKASLFLANEFIKSDPGFFKPFQVEGSVIEDHTLDHKLMSHLSYDEQKRQICGQADLEEKEYGARPVLFRPPGGDYNKDTLRAAAACGMKAVVNWIAKANGGAMQYQVGNKLRPGDVVLMHFRPEFRQDMQAFLNAQNAAGLHTELLEDWLPR